MHQTWIFFFIAILWSRFQTVSAQSSLPLTLGLFVDRLTIADASAIRMYYSDTNKTLVKTETTSYSEYIFNWRETLPNSSFNSGLSFHNYLEHNKNKMLSFKAQLSNLSITGVKVSITPGGIDSAFRILTFNVLLVSIYSSYIELITCTRSFMILNVFPRSSDKEAFQEISTKVYFNSLLPLKPYCVLQWIVFDSVNSKYQIFQFTAFPNNTNIIEIMFFSDPAYKNTLNSFKVNILLINPYIFLPNIATYNPMQVKSGPYITTPYDFIVPSNFGGSLDQNNCFFGLKKIYRKFDIDNTQFLFKFTTTGNLNINQIQCENQLNYTLQLLCFGQCPTYSYVNPTYPSVCQLCSVPIPNCLTCYNSNACIQCNSFSFLNNNLTCTPCKNVLGNCLSCINATTCITCFLGWVVDGGCTKVTGCTLVAMYQNGTSYCASCDPYFDYNFTSKICVCKTGRLVNLYCTEGPGCISTYLQNGAIKCGACLVSRYFVLDISTHYCVCKSDFFLNAKGQCQQICGDGKVYYLACDDGNLIDGDGCSSVCTVEILYQCTNSPNTSSICRFYGLNIQIQLVDTQKVESDNTGVFTFQFKPKMLNLAKLNLSNLFVFNASNSDYALKYWTFSDGFAKLYVDYYTDLEERNASVTFNFDANYFNHNPILYKLQVTSRGSKLIYEYHSSISNTMGTCILALSVGAYILLFLGSWFNKMIGVEFMQTLQIIYLSHFTIKQYYHGFHVFQYLAFVGMNDRFFTGQQINLKFFKNFQILTFNLGRTQATLIGIAIFVSLSIFFLCFVQCKLKNSLESKYFRLGSKITSNFIFPTVLTLTYPYFLLLATLKINNQTNYQSLMSDFSRSVLVLLSFSGYSILSFQFFKHFFLLPTKTKIEPLVQGAKSFYIISYKIFMFLILVSLWIWLRMGYFACSCLLLALLILKLIVEAISRPYYSILDNLGIIMNVGVTIIFLTCTLVFNLQLVQVTEQKIQIFVIAIVSLLYFCFLISTIRVIIMIKNRKKDIQDQDKIQQTRNLNFGQKDPNQGLLNKQKSDLNCYKRALLGKDPLPFKETSTQIHDQQRLYLVGKMKRQFRSKHRLDATRIRNKP